MSAATEAEIATFEAGADYFALESSDHENLQHETLADLLGEHLENMDATDFEDIVRAHIAGESVCVEVESFKRGKVTGAQHYADRALEGILESLDDDYAGDEPSDATEAMKTAARVFADAVIAEYRAWRCERAGTILIDLVPYARETVDFAETVEQLTAVMAPEAT